MLKSEREYPISNAVSDVFRYNDACSLVEGFSTANQALTLLDHPGLDELNRALVQTNVSRTILDNQNIVDARILRSDGSVDADALAKLGVTYGPRIPDSGSSDGFSALQAAQAAIVTGAAELRSSFDRAMADNAIATALAPPTPTVAMELDAIIKASTAALADSCQPKIVTAQAALTNARLAFSSSTLTDKSGLRLDLSQQQAIADGLQYAVRIYENNVVGRMANAHSSFKRAVATFQGSDKSPSHATDLTNAIAALRVALVTLSGEVAVGQAKQPSCLG